MSYKLDASMAQAGSLDRQIERCVLTQVPSREHEVVSRCGGQHRREGRERRPEAPPTWNEHDGAPQSFAGARRPPTLPCAKLCGSSSGGRPSLSRTRLDLRIKRAPPNQTPPAMCSVWGAPACLCGLCVAADPSCLCVRARVLVRVLVRVRVCVVEHSFSEHFGRG